jgi:tetratricopeptide (TPR) repeat protein
MSPIRTLWRRLWSSFYMLRGDAHRHFGNSYGSLREYRLAVGDYDRALRAYSGNVQAYYNRGVLYWRELKEYERAVLDLTEALDLAPGLARARFNRGMAHKLLGEWDLAQRDFQAYLSQGRSAFWLDAAQRQLAELEDITAHLPPALEDEKQPLELEGEDPARSSSAGPEDDAD